MYHSSEPNGLKWTKGPEWTELDQMNRSGPNVQMDQSG